MRFFFLSVFRLRISCGFCVYLLGYLVSREVVYDILCKPRKKSNLLGIWGFWSYSPGGFIPFFGFTQNIVHYLPFPLLCIEASSGFPYLDISAFFVICFCLAVFGALHGRQNSILATGALFRLGFICLSLFIPLRLESFNQRVFQTSYKINF